MHGYEANLELERRCIRDWAAISRPQVYYSLEKLASAGFIRKGSSSAPAYGPERTVFATTSKGRAAIADALEQQARQIGGREYPHHADNNHREADQQRVPDETVNVILVRV